MFLCLWFFPQPLRQPSPLFYFFAGIHCFQSWGVLLRQTLISVGRRCGGAKGRVGWLGGGLSAAEIQRSLVTGSIKTTPERDPEEIKYTQMIKLLLFLPGDKNTAKSLCRAYEAERTQKGISVATEPRALSYLPYSCRIL